MSVGILTDLTKCIGCEACVVACRQINELQDTQETNKLSASTWTAIRQEKGVNIRQQCMHCQEPACASACPVGAMHKTPEGPVIWDDKLCMGCRYCMVACPFSIPTYEWAEQVPAVRKCIMCHEKAVSLGQEPACTAACPTGATIFGDREELIAEAQKRIVENPGRYVNHIYGVKEAGGTSVLYLADRPFEELGFPANISEEKYPELTWEVLSKLPTVVSTFGVALAGIYWITSRRDEVAEAEAKEKDND